MADIVYNCFAIPPKGIKLDTRYPFGHDSKGYFYVNSDVKIYMDIKELKGFFSPTDGKSWDEVIKAFESISNIKSSKKDIEK